MWKVSRWIFFYMFYLQNEIIEIIRRKVRRVNYVKIKRKEKQRIIYKIIIIEISKKWFNLMNFSLSYLCHLIIKQRVSSSLMYSVINELISGNKDESPSLLCYVHRVSFIDRQRVSRRKYLLQQSYSRYKRKSSF